MWRNGDVGEMWLVIIEHCRVFIFCMCSVANKHVQSLRWKLIFLVL